MTNVAAFYLLSRNGAFKRLFSGEGNGGGELNYAERYDSMPNGGDKVLESYLSGHCKMSLSGFSNVSNIWGDTFRANLDVNLPKYKQYAEKQLEMIEPPSFLEKMMVINKAAANTKLGKIAGKATLGAVPVALTITALSARAYGASRHFVMDKLNLHQSDKKSFSRRLAEIKNREGYKGDLKKIAKLETLREKSSVRARMLRPGHTQKNAADAENKLLSKNALLDAYMNLDWQISAQGTAEGVVGRLRDENGTIFWNMSVAEPIAKKLNQNPLKASDLKEDLAHLQKTVEMIDPLTKTELKLIRRMERLKKAEDNKFIGSPVLKMIDKSVELSLALYSSKNKEGKERKGTKGFMARMIEVQKRSDTERRLNKMRSLEKKLKAGGR